MRSYLRNLAVVAGAVLGVSVPAAPAQTPPGVYRMEINNGAQQTVRYFANRVSPGEAGALRDLERAENEVAYEKNLIQLKRQYVRDERALEAERRQVQQQLYGMTLTALAGGGAGYGGLGYLSGFGYPGVATYAPGWGGYYGLGGYATSNYAGLAYGGLLSPVGGLGGSLSRTLAADFAGQSTIKSAVAPVIAADASEASLARAERDLDRAVATVASSEPLRVALNLPSRSEAYVRPVAASEATGPVTLLLNDGKEIKGSRMEETRDWITVYTRGGRVRIRPAEVKRITEGASSAVAPAAGPDKSK